MDYKIRYLWNRGNGEDHQRQLWRRAGGSVSAVTRAGQFGAWADGAVVAPALSSAGGRVVDLSAELGEPAGSWQVAEPGSGGWAVLRDGARVGM